MGGAQLNILQLRWLRDMYGICQYKTQPQLIALRRLLDHLIGQPRPLPPVALTQFELARLLRSMERSGKLTATGKEELLAATRLGIHPRAPRKN